MASSVEDIPKKIKFDQIDLDGRKGNLISADHRFMRHYSYNDWESIENKVKASSIVFVEYFTPELKRTAYNTPVVSDFFAKSYAEGSYIDDFSSKIESLAIKHRKPIAVADIANKPEYVLYEIGIPFGFFTGLSLLISEASGFFPFLENWIISTSVGAGAIGYDFADRILSKGVYSHQKKTSERFLVHADDARRTLGAEGFRQEVQLLKPGSEATYIAPHAQMDRIQWNLENPDNGFAKTKKLLYRHGMPGLDRSVRTYRFSSRFQTWDLSSNRSIN